MNFKKYMPFEKYLLTTKLPTSEVCKRLSENIEPRKVLRFSVFNNNPTKPYEGEISGNTFVISRVINYRNLFVPVVTGEMTLLFGETHLKITMKLTPFTLLFICVWLGLVGFVCLILVFFEIFHIRQILQSGFSPMILIPFAMFIFGCLLTSLAFKAESKKSKEFLETLLNAQQIN